MNNYSKEELLEKANTARHVAIILAENIYRYLGGNISKDGLKLTVDTLISAEYVTQFYHKYILKDTYESTIAHMFEYDLNEHFEEDDTETLLIKEGDDDGRAEETAGKTK